MWIFLKLFEHFLKFVNIFPKQCKFFRKIKEKLKKKNWQKKKGKGKKGKEETNEKKKKKKIETEKKTCRENNR